MLASSDDHENVESINNGNDDNDDDDDDNNNDHDGSSMKENRLHNEKNYNNDSSYTR